jgi:hypothetical protein
MLRHKNIELVEMLNLKFMLSSAADLIVGILYVDLSCYT